jgi:hypothetical protein
MLQTGFHRVKLAGYTGFKSSPYTEGALFYGERLAAGQVAEIISPASEPEPAPLNDPRCEPGGA